MWTAGTVIRDHRGQVLAAQCVNVQYHPRGVHPKFVTIGPSVGCTMCECSVPSTWGSSKVLCLCSCTYVYIEVSFAEIIVEGPSFHPVDTLKNRPSGLWAGMLRC